MSATAEHNERFDISGSEPSRLDEGWDTVHEASGDEAEIDRCEEAAKRDGWWFNGEEWLHPKHPEYGYSDVRALCAEWELQVSPNDK